MNNLKENKELLFILTKLVYEYPELRFSQILSNYGFVKQQKDIVGWYDEYYLYSEALLTRVKQELAKLR